MVGRAITYAIPARWSDFTSHFQLVNYLGTDVGTLALSDLNKTMFFLPDCDAHIPAGGTGGRNFGVIAKVSGARKLAPK